MTFAAVSRDDLPSCIVEFAEADAAVEPPGMNLLGVPSMKSHRSKVPVSANGLEQNKRHEDGEQLVFLLPCDLDYRWA